MFWKIEDMSINHSFNTNYFNTMGGRTIPIQGTQESQVDLTIRVRDIPEGVNGIEDFESAMKNFNYNGHSFTESQIKEALEAKFPEYFI